MILSRLAELLRPECINNLDQSEGDPNLMAVKICTGPLDDLEVASIYIADGVIWIDVEPPLNG